MATSTQTTSSSTLMNSTQYRESLRSLSPEVFVDGHRIEAVADEPKLMPGINAIGLTYDIAHASEHERLATATQHSSGQTVNRLLHINTSCDDLLDKLELTRIICQETGCAQRYLSMDGLNALYQSTLHTDEVSNTEYHDRFLEYLHTVQRQDLTLGVAMTDAKGDRSLRPHEQPTQDTHLYVAKKDRNGVYLSGTKAIVTGAPYVHELLVLPGRAMTQSDHDFAIACAVPIDAKGLRIVARPAGRPGESGAKFSGMYGQSTGVCLFKDVFVPWDRVFLCGEWAASEYLTKSYATHHRHTCIGARAGFGDLLIGAGAMMIEANGLNMDKHSHLRESMVELIKIVESFYACGVAASVYGQPRGSSDPSSFATPAYEPDAVFANIGKLLMATKIYDMHRLAHEVSGGLIVTLPGPDEDHNPETEADLAAVLTANASIPWKERASAARFMEDLTASYQSGWYSVISLHGGGSPQALKGEIFRQYPVPDKKDLVQRLLDRGTLLTSNGAVSNATQPGQCCDTGCVPPGPGTLPVRFEHKK